MKKLLLSLFTVAVSVAAYAQPNLEVRVDGPTTAITSGQQFNLDWTVKNTGTIDFTSADTIFFFPTVNGSYLDDGTGNAVYWGYINSAVAVGDSTTFSRQWGLQGGSSTTFDLCLDHLVWGTGWTGVTESDTADAQCLQVQYINNVGLGELEVISTKDNSYYAKGIYHLRLENALGSTNINMTVFNITGQIIQQELLNGGSGSISTDINLATDKAGVYIVKLSNDNGETISTKKIMVK